MKQLVDENAAQFARIAAKFTVQHHHPPADVRSRVDRFPMPSIGHDFPAADRNQRQEADPNRLALDPGKLPLHAVNELVE